MRGRPRARSSELCGRERERKRKEMYEKRVPEAGDIKEANSDEISENFVAFKNPRPSKHQMQKVVLPQCVGDPEAILCPM